MAAYAADQYRESVRSSVYSTDSNYSPLTSILRNYPPVPEAASSKGNASGHHFPPTSTGTIPNARYDPNFSSTVRVPPERRSSREGQMCPVRPMAYSDDYHLVGVDSDFDVPSSHTQFQFRPDSMGSHLNSYRELHHGGDNESLPYDAPPVAHYYTGPATSVVPPTPTRQEPNLGVRFNAQHLSAISAVSSYSQDTWSEGNVRETWRSSSTSGAADPFSFRHFETPQMNPPRVVVSSAPAPQDDYVYGPTTFLAPTAPAGRVPSKVPLQYNFSRPIRKESSGEPPGRGPDNSEMETYPIPQEDYSTMTLPRNLPKTTPNPMYGDENFLQSSPSVSPHASPHISASGSQMMGSYSSPARSPSPISLNSGSARDLFYQRQYQQSEQQSSPPDSPSNDETRMQASQSNVTAYSEDNTRQAPATKPFITLPSSPLPIRPGSSNSLYSRYSFYSVGDLPSGSSTPQPGARFENLSQTGGSSSSRTPTPTQQHHLTTSNSDSNDNTHSRAQENLDNPQTPHEFLALGIMHHEANRLQESAYCFERAATEGGGCGVGMLMWGLSLRHAWGTEKDERAAFGWLRKAADAAVTDLERATEKGERNAVKSELVLAIYEVGQCFFHGWGVETDKKMAVVSVTCIG